MTRFSLASRLLSVAVAIAGTAGLAAAQGVVSFTSNSELMPLGPVVLNQPYSADVVSTTTQVLADGTRIERSVAGKVYRDSAGRTRREQTILGFSWGGGNDTEIKTITISDPSTGVTYTLDERSRTARRVPLPAWTAGTRVLQGDTAVDGGRVGAGRGVAVGGGERARGAAPLQPGTAVFAPQAGVLVGGAAAQAFMLRGRGNANAVTESLGTRTVEGVAATGQRTVETIPVGQIGNDRPIVVTDERWESADLGVLVSSIHRDPRTGDIEYRLVNISRAEPPAAFFTVPPDYRVIEIPGAR